MGLPISNFSTFLSLCDKTWDNRVVNRIFSQFKLTAIVLCDPNDPNFIDKFDTLDRMTGKDLLFITFTNSPCHRANFSKWISKDARLDNETQRRLRKLTEVSTIDNIGMADLARRFSLSPSHLPAIVITDNLSRKEAIVLRTTRERIAMQLLQLTYEVAEQDTPIDIHNLDLVKHNPDAVICSLRAPTSDILTNAFGNIQLKENPNNWEAKHWNDKAVIDSLQRLSTMDDTSETELAQREEELMDYAANRLVQTQRNSPTANSNRFVIDENRMRGVESDTMITLITYNLLTRLFVTKPESNLQDFKYDYSALALYLSKVFENELAYSIVQQMRQVKGIPMPEYYCKVFRGSNESDFMVETPRQTIDLNKRHGRSVWVAPALGEMRMAYQKMAADGAALYDFDNVFLDNIWQPMILERNKAAHRNPIDWKSFDATFNYFRCFLDGGYFQELVGLKNKLKNREETDSFGNSLTLFES